MPNWKNNACLDSQNCHDQKCDRCENALGRVCVAERNWSGLWDRSLKGSSPANGALQVPRQRKSSRAKPVPSGRCRFLMPLSMSQSISSDTPWPACLPHCTLQITALQRVTRGDLSHPKSGLPEPPRSPSSGTVSREAFGRAEEAERKQPPPPETNT